MFFYDNFCFAEGRLGWSERLRILRSEKKRITFNDNKCQRANALNTVHSALFYVIKGRKPLSLNVIHNYCTKKTPIYRQSTTPPQNESYLQLEWWSYHAQQKNQSRIVLKRTAETDFFVSGRKSAAITAKRTYSSSVSV